jgi:hypothetical protein
MVGGPAERSRSPACIVEELVARMPQRSTSVVEPQAPTVEARLLVLKDRQRSKLKRRRPPKPGF